VAVVTSLLAGVAFGLAMAAPPGPMNAVIAEESVRRGFPAGFRAGLGAMTGDAIFCVLAFVGVVEIVEHAPTLRAVMIGVGGCLMLVFAVDAAGSVRERSETEDGSDGETSGTGTADDGPAGNAGRSAESVDAGLGRSTGFRKALALSLTNPYQIVFWLTVGVGLLRAGSLDLVAQAAWLGDLLGALGLEESLVIQTGSPALLFGFFGGIGAWITGYPATLVAVDRRSERAGPVVAGISALVLGGFGILFLLDAATSLV
jgi:threonine/homoserine/homoserine lactone efflux protein